jgi:hypothetical protein
VIYAEQLKEAGISVDIQLSGSHRGKSLHDYKNAYVYHGNDFSGALNLFGGIDTPKLAENVTEFSRYTGQVFSLGIPMPSYSVMLSSRLANLQSIPDRWRHVDWNNFEKIQAKSVTLPNVLTGAQNVVLGDSHAISLYRPGWFMKSIPFKTLHGALKQGLSSLIPFHPVCGVDLYFGNIDVRHHFCRLGTGIVPDMAAEYVRQASKISDNTSGVVSIYEPLPIENESRRIPKTGYYKGQPFWGSWTERNAARNQFIGCIETNILSLKSDRVRFVRWTKGLENGAGELDFDRMERPKSVHLSRASYPFWQGLEWNHIDTEQQASTLENFLQ